MADPAAMLAAVLAAPADDEPRLVYADWLTERGDPRGTFIQIQCQLGGTRYGAKGYVLGRGKDARSATEEELQALEKKLLAKHQKAWIAPIRAAIRTWSWTRGFVSRVEADGAKFLEAGESVVDQTPLESLKLTALKPPQHEALGRSRVLARVRHLDVAEQKIGPKTAHLFSSPHLGALETLELWGNPLGDAGAVRLAQADLPRVRQLGLYKCALGDAGLRALARARFFPQILHLQVNGNPFGVEGLEAVIARGEHLLSMDLNRLHTRVPPLGDDAAVAFANASTLGALERLRLDWSLGPRGVEALLASATLPKLRIVSCATEDEALQARLETRFSPN